MKKCLACADDRFKLNKYGFCERCAVAANRMRPDKKYGSTPIKPLKDKAYTLTCPECKQTTEAYFIEMTHNGVLFECDKCDHKWYVI